MDEDDQTFDPDGDGDPSCRSRSYRIAGASPALHHLQTPVEQGNSSYAIYMYVTWVDSPTDGLVVSAMTRRTATATARTTPPART